MTMLTTPAPSRRSVLPFPGTGAAGFALSPTITTALTAEEAGLIAHRHIGPILPAVLENTILPLVEELRAEAAARAAAGVLAAETR